MNESKFILNGRVPEACSDTLRWGRWYEAADRRVVQTDVGEVWVSTVFLGLDHQWGNGPPKLFETMCFVADCSSDSFPFDRYSTWEEAETGHAKAVAICGKLVEEGADRAADIMAKLRLHIKEG